MWGNRAILPGLLAWCLVSMASAQAQEAASADDVVAASRAQPFRPLEDMWVRLDVCGSGAANGSAFLNSYDNYRDPRSLNVELVPALRSALAALNGQDPVDHYLGRRVLVFGAVRQVPIQVRDADGVVVHVYHQTQMRLTRPDRILVVENEQGPERARCDRLIA
ncbi:hypothetical protein [Maricaulis maris]|uniref:Uncharacterized protein n=1 Tax=Maricaulis maris TaxID=74318 RepID=A0A495DMJ8_9PROT|nr:hypothetical protein [Maricaulis maris]RKR04156.1 hypothetical protein C7435_0600 [Maricaulis maris]